MRLDMSFIEGYNECNLIDWKTLAQLHYYFALHLRTEDIYVIRLLRSDQTNARRHLSYLLRRDCSGWVWVLESSVNCSDQTSRCSWKLAVNPHPASKGWPHLLHLVWPLLPVWPVWQCGQQCVQCGHPRARIEPQIVLALGCTCPLVCLSGLSKPPLGYHRQQPV